jgi:hypothetical protein
MGGGKSSGQSQTTVQPMEEQKDLLRTQTDFLKGTALPAYKQTVGGAADVLSNVMPAATTAATGASDVASRTGALQELIGTGALATGTAGLASLFDPQYEEQQVRASMQPGIEEARNLISGQTAQFGGAGGAGSTREAIARKSLEDITAQRLSTAAATARAGVQANKAAAGQQLALIGGGNLSEAQKAAASKIGFAGVPQDIYSKYASVVYGIPQGNTTANFTGTQGSTTAGSSKGFGFGK